MGTIIVDTNVVIYHLNGQLVSPIMGELCVSIITEIELLGFHGLTDETELPIRQFLKLARCVEIDNEIKVAAINLRKNSRLKLADAVVAATAIVTQSELLTHDTNLLAIPGLRASAPPLK